ncbi:MAG: tetratricopeptide repeat protein [Woeseiaceae bacterium]|nr:tetratricopeptide repeat protein [Woeseiaceae bacterium]
MNRFIRELRRREVFRTAGLYVGICWILIEVATVVLPTFGTPEWVLRAAIIIAFAGFPIMLVFAWVFDISKEGIHVQADPTDTIVEQLGARKTDFVVMGVLTLALVISLYLNISGDDGPAAQVEPVTVLLANFENTTGDSSFDGVLEEALLVGLEVAPHVTVLRNHGLANEVARRQSTEWLVTGLLERSGDDYRITVDGVDRADDGNSFSMDEKADSRDAVLKAIGELSAAVREELGDTTEGDRQGEYARRFKAASLDAAAAYVSARQLHNAVQLQDAAEQYRRAIELDPRLGRAVAGLALAEFALGETDQAEARWVQALALMQTMTEREQLRAVGQYSASVANDSERALATYADFVAKYPADVSALAGYAAASFQQLDLATAAEATRRILQVLPADDRQRTQLALYAMYSGDWDEATIEAGRVIAADPSIGTAYLPMAVAALARGQVDASREAYRRMASDGATGHGASEAELGLADVELFHGQTDAARERLRAGIGADTDSRNEHKAAIKSIALAQSYADEGRFAEATAAAANALQLGDGVALSVPAAMIYIQAGDLELARGIATGLAGQTDVRAAAYAQMLRGMIMEAEGSATDAVLELREAIDTADLWLIRFQLGKAYLQSDYHMQALDELMESQDRAGEAAAVFLDDVPTYRLAAELPYWVGRAQEGMNMQAAARDSYQEYVDLRPQGGALAEDARDRLATLN